MKHTKKIIICFPVILSIIVLMSNGCVKQDFDEPPVVKNQVDFTANTNIANLKAMYTGGDTVAIPDSIIIKGVVISSDEKGNFYKELVIQDSSAGIEISIDQYSLFNKYSVGQLIYVKCKDLYLGSYGGVVQLGSTYMDDGNLTFGRIQGEAFIDEHIFKDDRGEKIKPEVVAIDQISDDMISTLIKIENVQFVDSDLGKTYADATNQQDANRTLTDSLGNEVILRSSGYSDFAADTLPEGKGSIVTVLGKFNSDYQLAISSKDNVDFEQSRFSLDGGDDSNGGSSGTSLLEKNFDDLSLTSGGWTSYDVSGGNDWYVDDLEGDGYAKMSGYDGSSVANEDWLISPAMDLSSYSSVTLTFRTAMNYSPGPDLEIKVSTDYDGTSAPSTATWNDLSATLSSGSWSWVNSGEVNLTSYIGTSVYVAFKYTSTDSENEVWEVDDIKVVAE